MPKNIRDHDIWEKARKAAKKRPGYKDDSGASFYAVVTSIYKKMGGGFYGEPDKTGPHGRGEGPGGGRGDGSGMIKGLGIPVAKAVSGPGSRGGKVIGYTKSGKPVYGGKSAHEHENFTAEDHKDAQGHVDLEFNKKHNLIPFVDKKWKKELEDEKGKLAVQYFDHKTLAITGKHRENSGVKKAIIGPGSRGGKVIGTTKSGKPIYAKGTPGHKNYASHTSDDHRDVGRHHFNQAKKDRKTAKTIGESGEKPTFSEWKKKRQLNKKADKHKEIAKEHLYQGGGKTIGRTSSGKRIGLHSGKQDNFTRKDHLEAIKLHDKKAKKGKGDWLDRSNHKEQSYHHLTQSGGKVIGTTKSGKDITKHSDNKSVSKNYTKDEHREAIEAHKKEHNKYVDLGSKADKTSKKHRELSRNSKLQVDRDYHRKKGDLYTNPDHHDAVAGMDHHKEMMDHHKTLSKAVTAGFVSGNTGTRRIGPGSRGGKIIGYTKGSGKPKYEKRQTKANVKAKAVEKDEAPSGWVPEVHDIVRVKSPYPDMPDSEGSFRGDSGMGAVVSVDGYQITIPMDRLRPIKKAGPIKGRAGLMLVDTPAGKRWKRMQKDQPKGRERKADDPVKGRRVKRAEDPKKGNKGNQAYGGTKTVAAEPGSAFKKKGGPAPKGEKKSHLKTRKPSKQPSKMKSRYIKSGYKPANKDGADSQQMFKKSDGSYTQERQTLHKTIMDKYIGGAKPQSNPEFVMMGGGPAAGKSFLIKNGLVKLPDGHVPIDSDSIKGDLPEYQKMVRRKDSRAASFAHEESSDLSKKVMAEALGNSLHAVLDGTGNSDYEKLKGKVQAGKDAGHSVTGHYVLVDIDEAVRRNRERAKKTGRLVPETFVRNCHKSVHKVLKQAVKDGLFDELNIYESGSNKKLVSAKGKNVQIHDHEAWSKYVAPKADVKKAMDGDEDGHMDTRSMEIILREVMLGEKPSINTPEAKEFRKKMETESAEIEKQGLGVHIPHEWPDAEDNEADAMDFDDQPDTGEPEGDKQMEKGIYKAGPIKGRAGLQLVQGTKGKRWKKVNGRTPYEYSYTVKGKKLTGVRYHTDAKSARKSILAILDKEYPDGHGGSEAKLNSLDVKKDDQSSDFKLKGGSKQGKLLTGGQGKKQVDIPKVSGQTTQGKFEIKRKPQQGKLKMKKAIIVPEGLEFNVVQVIAKANAKRMKGAVKSQGRGRGGVGTRGGKVIGTTKSGKPIYDSHRHSGHDKFSSQDHSDAAKRHKRKMKKYNTRDYEDRLAYSRHENERSAHRKSAGKGK